MSQTISQRDLRLRSKEITDSVERGESFTVTRGGRQIGELVPVADRRAFVTRAAFAGSSWRAPLVDLDRFRADLDQAADQTVTDPYAR